jgi:hypothetical protein
MKSVVCVWTTRYHPMHKPPIEIGLGLGDMIRGALGLFEYCRENGYNFYLDIQLHPISTILDLDPSPYAELVKENSQEIKFIKDPDLAIKESQDEVILVSSLFFSYQKFSEESRWFILKALTPKKWVTDIFESHLARLGLDKYNIMHIRCGDNEFLNKRNSWKRFVAKQMIKNNYVQGDLLLTDSVKLKSELKNANNIKIFTDSAAHLATDVDSTSVLNTMLEFYAITKASKIKTYSRYSHISGFVYFPSIIYGIPLESLKMPRYIRILDIAINLLELYIFSVLRIFNRNSVAR